MNTAALVLIALGILLLRQVAVGRAKQLPDDIRDLSVSLLNGQWDAVTEVASRRGTALEDALNANSAGSDSVTTSGADSASIESTLAGGAALSLVPEMKRLAAIAKYRYVWGATGPGSYDCSGLVWKACKNLGIYKGPRFTTSTFWLIGPQFCNKVMVGQPNDIVVWPGKHMGVMIGPDKAYAARSSKNGIGEQSISGVTKQRGGSPEYWRIKVTTPRVQKRPEGKSYTNDSTDWRAV